MSKSFEQLAAAKINTGLCITGAEDGYHEIDSIFQSIRLSDSIYFIKHHSVFSWWLPGITLRSVPKSLYGKKILAPSKGHASNYRFIPAAKQEPPFTYH